MPEPIEWDEGKEAAAAKSTPTEPPVEEEPLTAH
jgi:hypothetical protein